MARELLGKEVNASLNARIRERSEKLKEEGVVPTLCMIRLGEKPSDLSYERGAEKRCETLGVGVKKILLEEGISQEELLSVIEKVNRDPKIHAVLLFRPLPAHLDPAVIENALLPEKDVDCMSDLSMAGVYTGKELGFAPCTPAACMEILDHYGIDCSGKRAVIVGRSLVVGKPAAMMLLRRNATVTVCHTRTRDLPARCREADILIAAAGRANMIGAEHLRAGQIVLDVGINLNDEGKLCGDVNFLEAKELDLMITPVPGGVGTVTTSVLVSHVVSAAEKAFRR